MDEKIKSLNEEIAYLEAMLEVSEDDGEKAKLNSMKERLEKEKEKLESTQLGAIGTHKTEISEGPWDGSGNEANLKGDQDASYYHKMYAWQDSGGDPKLKGSYKFPHHEVDSEGNPGKANLRACQTGIAVLNGARGGTKIPASDKRGVWNHLASHIKDAGKEPAKLLEDMSPEERDEYLAKLEEVIEEMEIKVEELKEYAKKNKLSLEDAEKQLTEIKEKEEAEKKRLEDDKNKDMDTRMRELEERFNTKLSEAEKQNKSLEDRVKNLVEDREKLQRQLHEKSVEGIIDRLAQQGCYPAQLEIAKQIMLSDSGTVKLFEEKEQDGKKQKVEIEKSLNEAVVRMLQEGPKVDLEEKSRQDQKDRQRKLEEPTEADIKKYAEENKVSVEEAETKLMNEFYLKNDLDFTADKSDL